MDKKSSFQTILFISFLLWHDCFSEVAGPKNTCDKKAVVTTRTECRSCALNAKVNCPDGYKKMTIGSGNSDCRYLYPLRNYSLSLPGCSHACFKEVLQPECCPGYWGPDCIECPKTAEGVCNNRGVCSEGLAGNGTCACMAGFGGTACENCAEESLYGINCSSVCSCVHGLCNNGIGGDGVCTCFSGYKAPNCDQPIAECTALQCPQHARCIEEANTGKLVCKCLPSHKGDGTHCTPINPCLKQVCHSSAVCTYLGPNLHNCKCAEGYKGDGQVCMPVDPCQDNFGNCSPDSTVCVYDGPGKSHCRCKKGFENMIAGIGCSLTDICKTNNTCDKNAKCETLHPEQIECTCNEGYVGDGKTCYGNIMQRLRELNSEPGGKWTGQLSNAITLFDSSLSWPLTSLGPFTIFIPINKGFKGFSLKSLVSDQLNARYLSKLHVAAGELSYEMLKRGDIYYTLTGKSAETVVSEEDQQVKIRIYGSKKKGGILQWDIIASNGIIHIISKLMDSVEPTVQSEKEENLMTIIANNGKFNKFRSLLQKANVAQVLEEPGPHTVFVPTNTALETMKEGTLDYLLSAKGNNKLLELLRNHIIPSAELEVFNIVSSPQSVTMANEVLTFNVTSNGQILVNGEVVLEADVQAKNGRLYSLDGVLIPASIKPVLPHRCDVIESKVKTGECVSCTKVTRTSCLVGVATDTFMRGCIYMASILGMTIPTMGCAQYCNETTTVPVCCKGFYGPDCSPCPGGFANPCSGHGQCMEGIGGNGTCFCEKNFKGSRCQYCSDPNKYGPNCDKTCPCVHGECDNRPESDGSCKEGTCQATYTGRFCERHVQTCGPRVEYCHAHADCDFNDGAVKCVCKPGYQGDGITCVELDPCAQPKRGGCSVNAKCIKTGPGTHECSCLTGWRADGDECQEINKCMEPDRGGCHPNATCIHIGPGLSDCECKTGFRGNGIICEAVNPCVEQNGGCHLMASCEYLSPGTWKCICLQGYVGDGRICYGNVATELSAIPDGGEFHKWVNDAGLYQMISEYNLTLLVPSNSAVDKMTKEDKGFWLTRKNLPSIVKYHTVQGIYQLTDLQNRSSSSLLSFLGKAPLRVVNINGTAILAGCKIISSDIAATNGLIHIIDQVLIPDRKLSEGLPEMLAKLSDMPEYSIFRGYLIQYNLTEQIEESDAYTLFAPNNIAITDYVKQKGSLDMDTILYHIVLSERLKADDLLNGIHRETMLGFSYQVGFFRRSDQLFINDVPLNLTNVETNEGVIHGLAKVLEIQKNHCDKNITAIVQGKCGACYVENMCPSGTSAMIGTKKNCFYSRYVIGKRFMTLGCRPLCKNTTIIRECCSGYFGAQCEACPGAVGKACFANGVCQDRINGTGECQCDKGFNGTACEMCQPGKYGVSCDQDCPCVNGQCSDGMQGDGSCDCDLGWRGVHCDSKITEDSCNKSCHTSANCLPKPDSTYYCNCAAGFKGNGTFCSAVDACESNNGGCSSNAICKRTTPGRRSCLCKAGYTGDGVVCLEINPCIENNGGCNPNAECTHTGPNQSACNCKRGYSGDGKECDAINPCRTNNGGCSDYATCMPTEPGERNCTCKTEYIGDGLKCKGTVSKELLSNRNTKDFYFKLLSDSVRDLKGDGPFTVFAPNSEAFRNANLSRWYRKGVMPQILRYHIVSCRALQPTDLTVARNVTTLQGDTITLTYSEDTIYLNHKAKVVSSDVMSINGIIHEIDTVLVPENLQVIEKNAFGSTLLKNLSTVVESHGYSTIYKLLEDTDVLSFVNNPIHQPVTLFLPKDQAMSALPQTQKDFLYNSHNKDKLIEYLKYHIVRDGKILASDLPHIPTLRTLQGSNIQANCGDEGNTGDLFLNNRKCKIVERQLAFSNGIVHGIDCMLTPPSTGGRCDVLKTIDIMGRCGRCTRVPLCPFDSKPQKKISTCDMRMSFIQRGSGCQYTCSVVLWAPTCCSHYFGRDCIACPGGPDSPCSNHGQCDEGYTGTGNCTCHSGFTGVGCELCLPGHYGPDCQVCNCTKNGQCEEGIKGIGTCFCDEGWTGPRCESELDTDPICSPPCSQNAVCQENNSCECKPFYEGDGRTCTVVNLCQQQNGGCDKLSKCTQRGVMVNCTCPKGYSGDGYVCIPIDLCVNDDNGGCHEHAVCTMTGPGKRSCQCKNGYIGDGVDCELKQQLANRCDNDNGQCHSDAQCSDLHFEDKTVGVFHLRSPKGQYKINYNEALEGCKKEGATVATYLQLSYAQQAGFHLCSAGWLLDERVAYPTAYANPKCGFGHVGIVDYGTRLNLSETWDTFCYRMKDMKCVCKPGYIGDGYYCSGNLLQVLRSKPTFTNFLSQVLNYSYTSPLGKDFVNRLNNLTIQSTLFVPDNSAMLDNETLSSRDIEYHLSDGSALYFHDLTNGSRIPTRLGHSLLILGFTDLYNSSAVTASRYVNNRHIMDWDIQASNGIIHVIQGPLRAPPPEPTLHAGHKAGIGVGLLILVVLLAGAGFASYRYYSQRTKPFQFHYFKSDEGEDTAPVEPSPNICNPMYEQAPASANTSAFGDFTSNDKHQLVNSGPYDLFQVS
ncbi:stabilin-2 isoform X2 [Amia ocellicauda]|uniref:stabilin-2 isoform X2 n=1 Tax=Amia ocellicauda TaxID=2972642 RepID=UPI003463C734